MSIFKERFLDGAERNGRKKNIENLIVFVIILIVTIVFINYIWKDTSTDKNNNKNINKTDTITLANTEGNINIEDNTLERQIENILKKLNGVEDVSVLITYNKTNEIVPVYNEDSQESITKEEDNQGGIRTINENSTKKEIVYEESNGVKKIVTSSVVTPEIKGAVIMAKGANNSTVKTNIIQAVEAATGLPTHKIQVFEMK